MCASDGESFFLTHDDSESLNTCDVLSDIVNVEKLSRLTFIFSLICDVIF